MTDNKMTRAAIIGGCGHVGLPLGVILAERAGVDVTLVDIDRAKIKLVNDGVMPFIEEGMEPVLKSVVGKTLRATDDMSVLSNAEIVVTVIGTPVDRHLNPLLTEINRHADETIDRLKDGALLILRSTLYPGVSKLIYDRIKSKGRNIHVAVCPERIAQGKAMDEMVNLPQIVGAFEKEASDKASELFLKLTSEVILVEPLEAEFGKLMCNSWRYLEFAIANQFYILCQKNNLDFYRIYDAFQYDYPRMRTMPKAGLAAGPCLLKDTLQLSAYSNNLFTLGPPGMVVNESLPNFIIERLSQFNLKQCVVAVLGMAFKGDIDDKRDSLAYKLRNLLRVYAKEVLCTDPYVPDSEFVPLEEAIERADIIILGTPHSVYRKLSFPQDKTVVDVFGFLNRDTVKVKGRSKERARAVEV